MIFFSSISKLNPKADSGRGACVGLAPLLEHSASENMKRQEFGDSEKALLSQTVQIIETQVTDEFFRSDIGIRGVSLVWLVRMCEIISGRDIWMSGQQLVD